MHYLSEELVFNYLTFGVLAAPDAFTVQFNADYLYMKRDGCSRADWRNGGREMWAAGTIVRPGVGIDYKSLPKAVRDHVVNRVNGAYEDMFHQGLDVGMDYRDIVWTILREDGKGSIGLYEEEIDAEIDRLLPAVNHRLLEIDGQQTLEV